MITSGDGDGVPSGPDAEERGGREARPRSTRGERGTLPEVRGAHGALSAARNPCGVPARAGRRRGGTGHRSAGGAACSAPGSVRREPLRRLLPQALVFACLAGGTSAFVADGKAVQLSIDGKPRILHTLADDIAGLLDDEGIVVGAHDTVAPAPHARLTDGAEVTVRHARRLRLTVDGQHRQVWTTARTVDGALRVLGVRPEGAYLSVSRYRRIDRSGLTLDVRTARTVRVVADGRTRTLHTNAATIRDAVHQAGIRLRGKDSLSVAAGRFPREGETIGVVRISTGREIRSETIPFRVERIKDPRLPQGTEIVARPGHPGTLRVVYATRTVDGVAQPPRRLTAEVVRAPRAQRLRVGTNDRATRAARRGGRPPVPSGIRSGWDRHRDTGRYRHRDAVRYRERTRIDRLDWDALARCESGGRPDAVDPSGTYGGLYQFDLATWRSLGGRGRPQDATRAEQTRRAKQLYASRGAAPWPVCGRRLMG